jgi:hypothetical protein
MKYVNNFDDEQEILQVEVIRFELTAAVRLISRLWDMRLRREVIES